MRARMHMICLLRRTFGRKSTGRAQLYSLRRLYFPGYLSIVKAGLLEIVLLKRERKPSSQPGGSSRSEAAFSTPAFNEVYYGVSDEGWRLASHRSRT